MPAAKLISQTGTTAQAVVQSTLPGGRKASRTIHLRLQGGRWMDKQGVAYALV